MSADLATYRYASAAGSPAHADLFPPVARILTGLGERRIFEVGCGNGSFAARLAALGFDVSGIDPSSDGIRLAKAAYPDLRLHNADAYEPLSERFGKFPIVLSLEVIEHVLWPRKFIATCRDLLAPGGTLILSTPYHGWLKNVAIAVTGKFDRHVDPLWDGGHIKFWSEHTLRALLAEAGFHDPGFERVGRIPPLAKSMIAVARQ